MLVYRETSPYGKCPKFRTKYQKKCPDYDYKSFNLHKKQVVMEYKRNTKVLLINNDTFRGKNTQK